ncbi:VOC family protein [Magnetovibrio sp.]|uniref:VOC family protein n=1 Tax=Magnetovibrio sp. TaxID=2024836 RepID=UPI0039C90F48
MHLGDPQNQADRQENEAAEKTDEFFQKGFNLRVADKDPRVEAGEVVRDVQNAAEQQKREAEEDQGPASLELMKPAASRYEKKDHEDQQNNRANGFKDDVGHREAHFPQKVFSTHDITAAVLKFQSVGM